MRIHLVAAAIAGGFGGAFQVSPSEWCAIALTIAGVMSLELMNTAVEAAVDLVTVETHPLARRAKDAAAAAVLVMAVVAVVIGLVIFVPRLIDLAR